MKVLITNLAHFSDRPSGGARFVRDEAAELHRCGDEVWVLASGNTNQPEYEVKEGIHLLRYVPAKVASWNPARGTGHQKAARGVLMRHLSEVDAVHGHAPLPYLAALDLYGDTVHSSYDIHSPAKMEMAIVWRNGGLLRRMTAPLGLEMINRLEKECLRRSRTISAESQFTIDCISKIHGPEVASSIQLFPGWADSARYTPLDREHARRQLGWPTDVPILFTLRRLVPRMGLGRLLSAVSILRREGVEFRLMIGGSGPLRAKLEEQQRELGLDAVVRFLGRLEDDQLPLAYAGCDAFVLPTTELECFGLIAVEALSAGRPVLATPVGAIPEIVGRFEPSWLAKSAEVDEIASLLRSFLKGKLPLHDPQWLHQEAHRHYGRDIAVRAYVHAMLEGNGRS